MLGEAAPATAANALGRHLRALRLRRGMSQEQLGGGTVSASYVSLIESGLRVPSRRVVLSLAAALGVAADELITGVPVADAAGRADLGLARAALAGRRYGHARALAEQALESSAGALRDDEVFDAVLVRAKSLIGDGAPADALPLLAALRAQAQELPAIYPLLPVLDAQCVAYWRADDRSGAASAGRALAAEMTRLGVPAASCPDAVLVAIASRWAAGDAGGALRLLRERDASARDRAEALAAAAHAARRRGAYADARVLADLSVPAPRERQTAAARTLLAAAHARLERARVPLGEAERLLLPVLGSLPGADPATQIARARIAMARCEIAAGRPGRARRLALRSFTTGPAAHGLEAGIAFAVLAEAAFALGQATVGRSRLADATQALQRSGRDREAAEAWAVVAGLQDEHGDAAAAGRAYRSALHCAGLALPRVAEPRAPRVTAAALAPPPGLDPCRAGSPAVADQAAHLPS